MHGRLTTLLECAHSTHLLDKYKCMHIMNVYLYLIHTVDVNIFFHEEPLETLSLINLSIHFQQ